MEASIRPSNFHSHCTFCDGHSQPEAYVEAALAQHFRAYGFSSHSPLPFETSWNMPACDLDGYILEVNRLKEKYRGRMEVYLGLEIDYLDETYNASIPYFQSLPLDYRIGSLHFLPWRWPLAEGNMTCIDGPFDQFAALVKERYGDDVRRVTKHFFDTSMQMAEAGGFDIVGHADKICMNGALCRGFDPSADWYRKPFEEYLHLIAEKGYIMEVNTKNFLRKGQTYPSLDSLKRIHKLRIPVMVNSDCHVPALVNDGRDEVLALLREAGFRTTRERVGGTWQDLPTG
ncbi:MAG: histidinol-phosphatase [Tannerella sp.]|jgi:histidinol-phosphatase (PHP family)|nr:histidinol-phosphatase [Tannerella sp.]